MADNKKIKRLEIPYFEGVNAYVGDNISRLQEFSHVENARSKIIGTIEKREGTRRLGNVITATANYGVFYFENSGNNGFYRVSTVGGITSIYYLNDSAEWTSLASLGTKIFELGSSTTQFDITNPSGTTFRYTYDTNGTDPDIDHHIKIGSSVVIAAENFNAANNGTFVVTGVSTNYFEVTNASGVAESNKTIGTGSITISGNKFSHAIADGNLFLVNGDNDNMYVSGTDGTTVTSSTTSTGNLYNSPKARKINYYKDRLYVADYTIGSSGKRYKNSIMRSSMPVGIVALVDGDHAAADCGADDWIKVTDTKYIYATDTVDVYRGGTKIADITIKDKTENSFQINAITFAGSYTTLDSIDEVWVDGTYDGTRVFRWTGNPRSGVDVQQYDTFKISGGQNDRIKMLTNIADLQVIANNDNFAVWNDYNLQHFNTGIGCVSDNGYVKSFGRLFFLHYTGIFSFDGSSAPNLISMKVDPYIKGATKEVLEAAAMGRKGNKIFVTLSSTTLYHPDGSVRKTLSDIVIEYDLKQENWFVHTRIKATEFRNYPKTDDADRLEFASTESGYHIFEFLNGQLDDRVTSDKEIAFRVDTKNITLADNFEKFCYPTHVIIETERGSGLQCFVSLDNQKFYPLNGTAIKGCVILKVNSRDGDTAQPPRCRRIKLSFRDNTRKLCRISRVALIYIETSEDEEIRQEFYEN